MGPGPDLPARILADAYGMIPTRCAGLAPSNGGRCWRVEVDGRHYVLKQFARDLPAWQIRLGADAQNRLSHQALAPALIPTLTGTLLAGVGRRLAMLSEHAGTWPGDSIRPDPTHFDVAKAMGALLARLHLALGSYAGAWPETASLQWPSSNSADLEHLRALVRSSDVASELDERAAMLTAFPSHLLKRWSDLPRQWIHGDYWSGNILGLADTRHGRVIDFDHLSWFPPCYEIARGFFASLIEPWTTDSITRPLHAYLSGYHQIRPLARDEADALIGLYQWIGTANFRDYQPVKYGQIARLAYARLTFQRMRRIAAHRRQLEDVVAAVMAEP